MISIGERHIDKDETRSVGLSSTMSATAKPFVPAMSVMAEPFVPRGFGHQTSSQASAALSVNAPEFVPRSFVCSQIIPTELENPQPEVRRYIQLLTSNPADFDIVIRPLVDLIKPFAHNSLIMDNIVDELFKESLHESNFRYTGARIFRYLSENLELSTGSFERLLLNKCFTHNRDLTALTPDSAEGVENLATFALLLGEFIVNMKTAAHVMLELPQVLKELLLILIANGTEEALSSVLLILKLTNGVLREYNVDIEDVLKEIKASTQNTHTPKLLQEQLNSVLMQCSKPSVGKTAITTAQALASRAANYGIDLEPIYYDHAGQAFSADEKALMDGITGFTDRSSDEDDDDDDDYALEEINDKLDDFTVDDDGMDPEIAAACDQFLREIDESITSPPVQPANFVPSYTNSQSSFSSVSTTAPSHQNYVQFRAPVEVSGYPNNIAVMNGSYMAEERPTLLQSSPAVFFMHQSNAPAVFMNPVQQWPVQMAPYRYNDQTVNNRVGSSMFVQPQSYKGVVCDGRLSNASYFTDCQPTMNNGFSMTTNLCSNQSLP